MKRHTFAAMLLWQSVAPHAGAWIETSNFRKILNNALWSHPTRVRGLKHLVLRDVSQPGAVAPHAGAWIETVPALAFEGAPRVAPHAGAWIETGKKSPWG